MIKTQYTKQTIAGDSQEINIYKLADDENWNISCTIPKYARKYRKFLFDGVEVINEKTNQLVEIHGKMSNKSVALTVAREMSEEQRQVLSERMKARMSEK